MLNNISNGVLTESEKNEVDLAKNAQSFTSNLKVFKSTMGIRKGEFSVIVGPAGNGKSALCKTISTECAIGGKKCYHILSEEKSSVYKSTISNTFVKMTNGKSPEKFLNRLFFESMMDWEDAQLNKNYFFDHLQDIINELCPDMVIFDNFTTSFMGSLPINIQADMISRFRKTASAFDIAIVGVFHTAKGTDIYKRALDGEDVRGNASTTNAGSYNYILSTYFRTSPPRAIINIDKARYHADANKTFYEMYYDKDLGIYTKDNKVDYATVKGIIDSANGSKKSKY